MTDRLPKLTNPTLADQAYEALRAAIISGELAPRERNTERGFGGAVRRQSDAGA